MKQDQDLAVIWKALLERARLSAHIDGGFIAARRGELNEWIDIVEPWPGQFRIVPARSTQGMCHWRHATAQELTRWVAQGCKDWGQKRHPVVALGSKYQQNQLPVVLAKPQGDARITLETQLYAIKISAPPREYLNAVLRATPDALALCVVPRG